LAAMKNTSQYVDVVIMQHFARSKVNAKKHDRKQFNPNQRTNALDRGTHTLFTIL